MRVSLGLTLLWATRLFAQSDTLPPPVHREFRGVWVATVSNIDWPSRTGLNTWEQQAELLAILNRAVQLNLNAVVLQVRPATDALYESRIEPWSEYLTGEMGRPPEPSYDPLAFAVIEAHKRGLELHAWFNPYRARHPSGKSAVAANHVSETRPEIVRTYGKHLWLDPGDPRVRRLSVRVITDVVRRYDIDGVHIDDYFYPYKERDSAGTIIDFPDDSTYARYRRDRGVLSRDDWRRQNVDLFVQQLYRGVKRAKPWVKFGISPFGVWRPGNPETIKGFDAYAEIYADSRRWLRNGWLDYFTPQLYWPIARTEVSYPVLLKWWVSENTKRRNIWPGNYTGRVGRAPPEGWMTQEILDQIELTRSQSGATGNIHFSARAFMQSKDSLVERLMSGPYAEPALVPTSQWLDSIPPLSPRITLRTDSATRALVVRMVPRGTTKVWLWTVRSRSAGAWTTVVVPGWMRSHMFVTGADPEIIYVTALDRLGNESKAASEKRNGKSNSNLGRARR
jgi:uncharacterized lipoprotein YddW (UPF0748 family)